MLMMNELEFQFKRENEAKNDLIFWFKK